MRCKDHQRKVSDLKRGVNWAWYREWQSSHDEWASLKILSPTVLSFTLDTCYSIASRNTARLKMVQCKAAKTSVMGENSLLGIDVMKPGFKKGLCMQKINQIKLLLIKHYCSQQETMALWIWCHDMLYENHTAWNIQYVLIRLNIFLHIFVGLASSSLSCGLSHAVWADKFLWLCALVTVRVTCPHPFNSNSDLFEKSDDILAHVCQTDNDVVVVDVTESGVVSALPPGLLQDQIPAVHSGHEILVLSETAKERQCRLIQLQHLGRICNQ